VVLIILALITGGIVAGKNIMTNAERRALIDGVVRYQQAISRFREKYLALPGDMPNATDVWGAADGGTGLTTGCFSADSLSLSNPRLTCNGNGDGRVFSVTGTISNEWFYSERFRAWQHLANAELVEGAYSGRSRAGTVNEKDPKINVPPAALNKDGGFEIFYVATGDTGWMTDSTYDLHALGAIQTSGVRTFSGADFFAVDDKIDDGKPATGLVFAPRGDASWQPGCVTANDQTALYNIANTARLCGSLYFALEGATVR